MGDVMLQSQRPVLMSHRMNHPWYTGYRQAADARIHDTFAAIYARQSAQVNQLVERYGVTHIVVQKDAYAAFRSLTGQIYKSRFDERIRELTRDAANFALRPPPRSHLLFQDSRFWLVRLPLDEPATDR